ncbi:MAG: recombinase family protein, partial [Bacteroides sp.]|nr:recombinase family protein [Bacteroides sp.]
IKDITVEKFTNSKQIMLHLRWQGGACEDIPVDIPPMYYEQIRYGNEIIEKVRALTKDHTNVQIASAFNHEGIKSAKGKAFTASMIQWIKYKHRIARPNLKGPEELTIKQVAKKFDVSTQVVYYWIKRKILDTRRLNQGSPYWIIIDSKKEQELLDQIRNSTRINRQSAQHP